MEIHWTHCGEIENEEKERVETRLRALSSESDDLREVRISGQSTGHHRHGAREIRLSGRAHGRDIAASEVRPDLALALHDALAEFERQVRRRRDQKRRGRKRVAREAHPESSLDAESS